MRDVSVATVSASDRKDEACSGFAGNVDVIAGVSGVDSAREAGYEAVHRPAELTDSFERMF